MRLLEPRPARVSFVCDRRTSLSFSTFDRPGDRQEVPCRACGRLWEQALSIEEGNRGWNRTLLRGPGARAGKPRRAETGGRAESL